jgi:uncharacterized membrane protein
MTGFLLEYLAVLLRWLHVVAAIAWIGESFYFVALDRGLKQPANPSQGLHGESWSVHGGGFYLKQKFLPAPPALPDDLHWSKWKSYTTWMSGFALFTLIYLHSPAIWLVDPNVMPLTDTQAVFAALGFLAGGWIVYDLLCKAVGFRDNVLGVSVAVLAVALCWGTTQVFSGRAAFLIAGATLATIMSANVFFVIIPGQKRMVAALSKGEAPNPLDGARGKQRSVHNTYFTLPVVFSMLAIHYANAWSHEGNWLLLAGFMLAGALIRQFFVLWHGGGRAWWLLAAGGAVLVALAFALAPKPVASISAPTPASPASPSVVPATSPVLPAQAGTQVPSASPAAPAPIAIDTPIDTAYIHALAAKHCTACHSATPKLMPSAPKGVMFDTPEQIEAHAALINQQVVVTKVMPPGNLTQMTEEERAAVARWFQGRTP